MVTNRSGINLLRLCGLLVFFILVFSSGYGQFYNGSQLNFGKNRVQYREFIWTYYMFDDFDVYFYRDGQKLAEFTSMYAQSQLKQMERHLESNVDDKIQFIVFNNLTDLKQSNIGLEEEPEYNTGGITKILGRKVILYFTGDYLDFEKQIRAGIANIVINKLLYGGSIGSQIKNSALFVLPDWYINGLISFLSVNWNTGIDNRVKDGIQSGLFEKFNHLSGDDALYAGHAMWRYISEEYGKSAVPDILHMTNISHSIENGFLYVLGVSFKSLMKECLEYYKAYYNKDDNSRLLPENMLLKKPREDTYYGQLHISPDGQYVTYITNELGQYKIWFQNLSTGKKKRIYKAGFKLGENTDYTYPILEWHPTGQLLAFVIERKGYVYLNLYNIETKKTESMLLVNFEKVTDFDYSDDGRKIVFSAVKNGQSDIFVFDIASGSHEQLTRDIYDDFQPAFIHNSKRIVFCSNRPDDTLKVVEEFPEEIPRYTDIFLYDYSTKSDVLRRLTSTTIATERQPMDYGNGYISFLSDENGIYNQFIGKFDSVISRVDTAIHYRYFMEYFPVTNYSRNILEQSISSMAGKQSKVIYEDDLYRLYIQDMVPDKSLEPVAIINTPYMQQQLKIEKEILEIKSAPDTRPGKDKMVKPRKRFRSVREGEDSNISRIDIDNYEFEKQSYLEINGDKRVTPVIKPGLYDKPGDGKFVLPKRRNYRVEYFFNELTTQIDFTFLNATYQQFTGGGPIYLNPGFNALFKIGVSDLMEDYRLVGGVRLNVNLVNNEYLFNYSNLKGRLDKHFTFHRQTLEGVSYYSIIRFHTNEFFYVLGWPFNEAMSVKGTMTFRNDAAVFLSTDQYNLQEPNRYENWVGLKGEFTFDDTRNIGLNLYYGTRYKIFAEYFQLLDKNTKDLFVIGADFRHYTRIHRTFIWANRIAASTSFGQNKLIYYMGGVDNWLFPKFNNETPIDFSENYRYQTLATNMRGFNQNIRNGNSFFVINSELRFPVFRYFMNRPIKSDFLNSFQIVAFGDVGTAWTGWNPYSKENSLYTRHIYNGPLHITVEIQKEPIVSGFGFGLRSRVLGYYLRADYAWGMEDWAFNNGVFYLSLSLDF